MEFTFRKRRPERPEFTVEEWDGEKTFQDFIEKVLTIHDDREAMAWFAQAVTWYAKRFQVNLVASERMMRDWIGWCFGEGMLEHDQDMWARVCGARHPVWGQRRVTGEEAFQLGMELGERIKRGQRYQEAIEEMGSRK